MVVSAGNISESGNVTGNVLSNCGVKIKKGNAERFTVALHGWNAGTEKDVYHECHKVGTIGDSRSKDIGLETPRLFSNTLLDIDMIA